MKLVGLAGAGSFAGGSMLLTPFTARAQDFNYTLIPASKNLDPDWVASLFARGTPSVYTGTDLDTIGMPVGGICCGQVYLSGDGRLWLWDIFNSPFSIYDTTGPHYAAPMMFSTPLQQGFALKIGTAGSAQYWRLDQTGFPNVSFLGQYPIGTVNYSDPNCPVEATLEAYSPFIPLNSEDSGIPGIIMEFTLRNTGNSPTTVELAGWLQNAVCQFTPGVLGTLRNQVIQTADATRILCSAEPNPAFTGVVYEDFEHTDYGAWVKTGTAFGNGPLEVTNAPAYMGPLNAHGQYAVNSHASAPGNDAATRDQALGTLTSPPFTIQHDFINFLIGGGNHPGLECMNLIVNGVAVLSATGQNSNFMTDQRWDVRNWKGQVAQFQIVDNYSSSWGQIAIDYIRFSDAPSNPRADIVFADFEGPAYAGLPRPWTPTGTAFGNGPALVSSAPSYMGPLNAQGQYTVNSYISSGNSNAGVGTLTSQSFIISRNFLTFLIGGGNFPGLECMNLLVNGQIVRTATGTNTNVMSQICWDVSNLQGQTAQLQIVDSYTGGWGQIAIDYIVFTDAQPVNWMDVGSAPDYGTMGLALLNPQSGDQVHTNAPTDDLPDLFNALAQNQNSDATGPVGSGIVGAMSRSMTLNPGEEQTVTFLMTWHFPKTQYNDNNINGAWDAIQDINGLQRYYASRFADAGAVADYLSANYLTLSGNTHLWRDTWYDSTLPYWFLDRTFSSASTLATNTCHRFSDGRFWGWEGVFCCAGTCTHVWQYAQTVARIFPDLERDTRQRVDFGLALQSNGLINYRAENGSGDIVDGQAGTILRAYREHQMSSDNAFLNVNWPQIKQAMLWLINTKDPNQDGVLEGNQGNTLDADWFGKISWCSGHYVAACYACQQMALIMGDSVFAAQLGAIAGAGANFIRDNLFYHNEYLDQIPDSSGNNVGSGWGCYVEQVLGQAYAFQLGLGRILDQAATVSTLQRFWKYNYAPDAGSFLTNPANPVSGGRVYAMPGEAGLVLSTFPDPSNPAPVGLGWTSMYFNECWTGFEHQVAAHMISEGMLQEGLAIIRSVHDRYAPSKRNPYNEIECSDHYARAMASYGAFIAICGYEYNGPGGYLAFSPKLTPENFKAAFTAAQGWGVFTQQRELNSQIHTILVKLGLLTLKTLAFDVPIGDQANSLTVTLNGVPITATMSQSGARVTVSLNSQQVINTNQTLVVTFGLNSLIFITGISLDGSNVVLNWTATGGTYSVYRKSKLDDPTWTLLATGLSSTTFTDTTANGIAGFYQISSP